MNALLTSMRFTCLLTCCLTVLSFIGCSSKSTDDAASEAVETANPPAVAEAPAPAGQPATEPIELDAKTLLAMRLDESQLADGWVRLFDGMTLFGWQLTGNANWSIQDNALCADQGDVSLLVTSLPWSDYELSVEFLAAETTNSGLFLRTPIAPMDPATDCYELNIAPPDNPFPTGSFVKRQRYEPADLGDLDLSQWHTFLVRCEGGTFTVHLDGRELYSYTDPMPIATGRIGLQYNSGPIKFRNVLARPLGFKTLLPTTSNEDGELAGWKRYPEMPGQFTVDDNGFLAVRGGRAQLESTESYADFALLTSARTNGPKQNGGIFFRCIPGEEMNGYECQINNDTTNNNPLLPADCGTGGIFRRQDARIVAADNDQWFTMLLIAHGADMAAWVNGIQVSEWHDDRAADPNPRRGLRLEKGTLMIQGHDPETSVDIRSLQIISYDPPETTN